jgi:hypothetical protein
MLGIRVLDGVFKVRQRGFLRPVRITLPADQVMSLSLRPPHCLIHVVSGGAWITTRGRDYVVGRGQEVAFGPDGDAIVMSATDGNEVVFEVRSDRTRRSS